MRLSFTILVLCVAATARAVDLQALLQNDQGIVSIPPGEYEGDFSAPSSITRIEGAGATILGTLTIQGGQWGEAKKVGPLTTGTERLGISIAGIHCLLDSRPSSWSGWRKEYRNGEFIDGRGERLASPLLSDYPAATQLFELVGQKPLAISGVTIRAPDDSDRAALQIRQRVGVTVRDVILSGSRWATCDINRCCGVLVDNLTIECTKDPESTISEYGLCIHNSQDVTVTRCRLTALRHAISLAGDSLGQNIVNRNIRIRDCDLSSYGIGKYGFIQAMHVHGNAELWEVSHCRIGGGIVVSGDKGRVIGNRITGRTQGQASIAVYFAECTGAEFTVSDNEIESSIVAGNSHKYGAVFAHLGEHTRRGGMTILARNRIRLTGPAAPAVLFWNASEQPWSVHATENRIGDSNYPLERKGTFQSFVSRDNE